MKEVLYTHLTPNEFRERINKAPVAYLPFGTLEWHGEHLPLGSDGLQSQGFFIRLAGIAGGVVLPMLFAGPEDEKNIDPNGFYGMDILGHPAGGPAQLPGSAYFMETPLFEAMLDSILGQLKRAGFKIVVAHGHGPSNKVFRKNAEMWGGKHGLILMNCWRDDESDGLGIQTDHAGANETSLMMALHPELVHMENLNPSPNSWPLAVMGKDPRAHASPETGEKALALNLEIMRKRILKALGRQEQN